MSSGRLILIVLLQIFCTNPKQNRTIHREYFYVGGEYSYDENLRERVMNGQIYVEHLSSNSIEQQAYPLVFIHGAGTTGTNWLNTPDGREGWATYFVEQGYEVYLIDQPARGRSPLSPNVNLTLRSFTTERVEKQFTATDIYQLWPQASLRTQWPGDNETTKGQMGDAVFDAFYASTVQYVADKKSRQTSLQKAGAALLDKIGPAVLVAHSQGATPSWLIADVRPQLVKGIVAIEPTGPPFRDQVFSNKSTRSWGLTDIFLTYDPPVNSSSDLLIEEIPSTNLNLSSCILQKEPARKLVHLLNIPILIEIGQASYHAVYDHCTAEFLLQAGANVELIRLENIGIYGNGHMLMLEKNNLEIAEVIHQWLQKNIFLPYANAQSNTSDIFDSFISEKKQ